MSNRTVCHCRLTPTVSLRDIETDRKGIIISQKMHNNNQKRLNVVISADCILIDQFGWHVGM